MNTKLPFGSKLIFIALILLTVYGIIAIFLGGLATKAHAAAGSPITPNHQAPYLTGCYEGSCTIFFPGYYGNDEGSCLVKNVDSKKYGNVVVHLTTRIGDLAIYRTDIGQLMALSNAGEYTMFLFEECTIGPQLVYGFPVPTGITKYFVNLPNVSWMKRR